MPDRETLLFVVGLNTWIFVAGALYAFPAWMAPLKAKFDLSQEVTLAIGTSIYAGFLIGLMLSTFIYNAVRRCFSTQWQTDAAVFGVVNVYTCSGYLVLRELFASTTLSKANGAALCMLSSVVVSTGNAVQFGIFFKHLLGVVATDSTRQVHSAAVYAVYASGGVATIAVASTIEGDAAWVTFFDVLFAVTMVSGCVTTVACGLSVKSYETNNSTRSSVNVPVEKKELLGGPTSEMGDDDVLVTSAPPEPRPPWHAVLKTYLGRREGWLVLCILLAKCFVGPVLTSQSTTMYKSARASSLSETAVVVSLNVGQTIGRTMTAFFGLRETIFGYDTTVVLNIVYGALFFIVSLVGSFELSEFSILLTVTAGGVAYGIMWATDSPTFLKVAESGADWPVLICLISMVEMAGCLGGNFIAGAVYDANGFETGAGTECYGLKCVQGTFVMMSVCSMCVMAASVSLAVRLRQLAKPPV